MAIFPDAWLSELLSKSDLAAIASEYTLLKPKGKRLWGCCPFHSEKTPSFSVVPDEQFYYCFGCHAGGSVVQFVMDAEKLTYVEAIKYLAQRAGMELPDDVGDDRLRQERALKERLYAACKDAAMFYHAKLLSEEGKEAQKYLMGRNIDAATAAKFGLGYAPPGWDNLLKYMTEKGYSNEHLLAAGLIIQGKGRDKYYDAYRDRVMFPIVSTAKRVLGFGARTMGNDTPKYLNTGDTPIFNKRNNLYGLNLQRGKHLADIIIVEGYMDVISLYKAGVTNAVASLGTALTQQQARLIKRYVPKVYISYDGDSAGQNATLRGLDILAKEGLDVRVIVIPDNMDPDDYAKKFGGQEYLALKDKALTLNGFKLDSLMGGIDLSTPDGREEYAKKACALLARLEPVEQERYAPVIARRTGLSKEAILRQCGISGSPAGNSIGNSRNTKQQNRERLKSLNKTETALLCCMIKSGEALLCAMEEMAQCGISFSDSAINAFAEGLLARSVTGEKLDIPLALSMLPQEAAESVSAAIGSEDTVIDPVTTAKDCVATMAREAMDERIKELAAAMQTGGSDDEKREYMELVKKRASLK